MLSDTHETTTSDEELACRAQQGCLESFDQLLRRFQTPVLHFLQRRGLSSDAEDLTQETFLRAYENLHRYSRRWAFSTWLFTIARRTGINHSRRCWPTTNDDAVESAAATGAAPLEAMVAAESRTRLWDRAASVLSEEQTTALWLHYVEDMSARAIAKVLGRSWTSVKVMLFRARKRLLPLLDEFDDASPSHSSPLPLGEGQGVRAKAANSSPHPKPLPKGEGTIGIGSESRSRQLLAVKLEVPHV
jgi:RNA polymerase sigma-70 factor, ECF subfamily